MMINSLRQCVIVKITNIIIQPVRYKNVINTRKPRNDHFWAKKMKLVYAPRKPKEFDVNLPMAYKCRKQFKEALRKVDAEEEYPYERILANEIKEDVMQSKMLLLIHRNPVGGYECFEATKKFVKSGMNVISHGKNTVNMAVKDTKFANIMTLFHKNTTTWLITCPEVKLHLALNLLKKMPYHILLAGIVEDRFMTRGQLEEYGKTANIDEVRAQLLAILNTPAMQLTQNLTRHQQTTVAYLNEYMKLKSTENDSKKSGASHVEKPDDAAKSDAEKT